MIEILASFPVSALNVRTGKSNQEFFSVELIELIKRRWRVFFRIDISNNKLLSDLRKLALVRR